MYSMLNTIVKKEKRKYKLIGLAQFLGCHTDSQIGRASARYDHVARQAVTFGRIHGHNYTAGQTISIVWGGNCTN
jgi:hypothetical protein